MKARAYNQRYDRTEKGRERIRRANASENRRSTKELYELTRVRVS